MARLSKDLSVGVLHPRESLFEAGLLASLNSEIVIDCDGASTVALDMRGTFSMTIEVAGSIDGVNWAMIPVRPLNVSALIYVSSIVGTAAGVWVGKCAPYRFVRARATAYTSGSCAAMLTADNAILDDSLSGAVTPALVTATGAAAAAVTLTIPAPQAGLRNFITYLSINRFAAAALTAAATPVIVTTTNIPGALAFSLSADAALQGTIIPWREDFAYALGSTAAGTATTIVCPATTSVIWRVTAGYYVFT